MTRGFSLVPAMYDVELIHVADILQLLTIFFTLLGFLPQLITLRVTKNSQGVSKSAWILWAVGSSMTLFYALVHYWFEGCCLPFVITTVLNCVLSLVMLVLIILYRVAPSSGTPRRSRDLRN
ncbi:MAG: PQ-loop domain-containing transporter [Gammaproteobacteria bacterium]